MTELVVGTLTKQTLGTYLDDTVFKALGMTDAGFLIPAEKVARYAKALPTDRETVRPPQVVEPDATRPTTFECGGAARSRPRPTTCASPLCS